MINYDHIEGKFWIATDEEPLYFDSVLDAKDAVRRIQIEQAVKAERVKVERLREALLDVLVYCPDYMHGLPKKEYERIAKDTQ